MSFEKESLLKDAAELGFSHAGFASVSTLKPMEEVRNMCAADKCHAYNKTWTCPPGCGTVEECGKRMQQYDWGLLVQTTAELEDSMDYEGMMEGEQKQRHNSREFLARLRESYPDVLALCAAGCDICKTCTFPDSPCRFPEKAVSAMEGYGLLVSQVCQDNDMKYYYGPNTVTYTGLFLIKEKQEDKGERE